MTLPEYLSGGRIQGRSDDSLATEITDNMTDNLGWTHNNTPSGQGYNATNDYVVFKGINTSSDETESPRISMDMQDADWFGSGVNMSDTYFVVKFELRLTTYNASSSGENRNYFGFFSHNVWGGTAGDRFVLELTGDGGGSKYWRVVVGDDELHEGTSGTYKSDHFATDAAIDTTYYITFTKTGGNVHAIRITTSNDYTGGEELSITRTNVTNLRYFAVKGRGDTQGAANGDTTGYIDNFYISSGSTDKDKSTITNVPAGTRYEETDTRKIFRRKDDGFTVGLGDSADMASDTGNTSVATITGQTDAPTFTTKGWSASSLQAYTETDALLIENDDWTISFWMNSTSFTSMGGSKSPRLVNGRTSGDVNTSLLIEGSAGNNPPSTHILNAQIYKDPSGAVAANGSSGMVTNNWYNVVVTWTKSSGTVTFYVDYDGASSTGTVGSSTNMLLPASGGYWLLGSVAEQFVGYVTDYAFWNKVLTSSERQALYNSGAGVAANTIAKENLRVYYDCQSEPEVQKNGATPAAWVEKGTA